MPIKNPFNNHSYHWKPLKGMVVLAFLFFSIYPAWSQDEEGTSDSKGQSSYPDLQPAGFFQSHFSAYDQADRPSGFSIPRARFGFAGDIRNNIQLNLIVGAMEPPNNTPALVNAFADFTIDPLFNLRAGQFLLPFGLEGPESIIKNPAIERAVSTRRMNPFRMFRDIGVMAYGTYDFVSYRLAVVNGNGANLAETRGGKDILGRMDFALTGELMAGFSGHMGTYASGPFENLNRQRWAIHAQYQNNPLLVRGEMMLQDREINNTTREQSQGGYLLAKYQMKNKWEAVGRWDYHSPENTDNRYSGITLGTNYQLSGLSSLSLNGTVYTEDSNNTIHYMLNIQLQMVL